MAGHHQLPHRRLQRNRVANHDDDVQRPGLMARFSPLIPGTGTTTDTTAPTTTTDPGTKSPVTTAATTTTSASVTTSSLPISDNTLTTTSTSATSTSTSTNTTPSTSSASTTTQTSVSRSALVTTSAPLSAPALTSVGPLTTFVTQPTLSLSAVSSTPTTQPDTSGSGTNVGGIVGGVAAVLLGLAVLSFIVKWLLARKRRHNRDSETFNANEFRRSAILIDDPPTHAETVARGYNPRPPTMIERKLATPAPTFGNQYGGGPDGYSDYNNDMQVNHGQFASYAPEQMMSTPQPPYPSPTYVSPIGATTPSGLANPYGSSYDESSQASGVGLPAYSASAAANPYLTRQPSASAGAYEFTRGPPSPTRHGADYVDLSRSSPVHAGSPFESPAFFAPVATDHEPLYSSQNQTEPSRIGSGPPVLPEVNVPRASSDFNGRPSEEYAKIIVSSGYDLPTNPLVGEDAFASRPSEDAVLPGYGSGEPKPREKRARGEEVNRPQTVYDEGDAYAAI